MKKSELYKIVKAELKSVLEEQRARIRRPERDPKNLNIPRDPNDKGDKIGYAVTGDGDSIDDIQSLPPCAETINYGEIDYVNTDCDLQTVNDSFMCCGSNNNSPTPNNSIGNITIVGQNISTDQADAGPGGCYCPNPVTNESGFLVSCLGGGNITTTVVDNYLTYINFLGITAVNTPPDLGYYQVETEGNPPTEVAGCYGCNQEFSLEDNIEASNYNENATLGSASPCIYPGCTDDQANNYQPDATEDNGSCEYNLGCTQNWAEEFDGEDFQENGSCETYLIGGCTDSNYVAYYNQPSAVQDQIDIFNQLTSVGQAINQYEIQYNIDVEYEIVDADLLPSSNPYSNADGNFYCGEDIGGDCVFGCMDDTFDTFNALATCPATIQNPGTGLCSNDEAIYGCTDEAACNYNEDATDNVSEENPATGNQTNEGVCEYPDDSGCQSCSIEALTGLPFIDGTGQVITSPDTDGDGICDANEIEGCTDPNAINYNPAATEDDGSCERNPDPIERKCKDITAVVCNAPQRKGQGKVGYAPISLGCVTIDGQTVNMDFPATSQFKYPLPSNILDPTGNPVSPIKKTMGIWQVTSAVNSNNAFEITDLPFGNCKGPVTILDPVGVGVGPAPLDPKIKERLKESKKLRNIIKKELKNWNT